MLLPHTDYKENEGGSEGFSFKQAFNYGHPNGYGETGRWRYDGVKVLKESDLKEKTIALFGCGDAESYCDTFCDGMGIIYEDIKDSGCTIVGKVSAKDYSFSSSIAVIDGMFVGLALDDINESDKTEERIDAWVSDIKNHLA